MDQAFQEYFGSPSGAAVFDSPEELSRESGYFSFEGTTCYGRLAAGRPARHVESTLPDVSDAVVCPGGRVRLPFDLSEVVSNLRHERYRRPVRAPIERITSSDLVQRAYYLLRPLLTVGVRKHLQRIQLARWKRTRFPAWPVDLSVDTLMQRAMAQAVRSGGNGRIPFIWFWPDGADSCAIVTHDVEGRAGVDSSAGLMDLDDSFGIKSAFQVVPERLNAETARLVESLRGRGFEVNIHDLSHDGSLFRDRQRFEGRARQINQHARELGSLGFRSGAMYREQGWYDAFEFEYDMSVPNVAHLEPQRGGCCTVMPYFIGRVLELPLTTTQDYSLFHILNDYSTALWKRQIEAIRSRHGLVSVIAHPDYLGERRARAVYEDLLAHLSRLRSEAKLWITLPSEVNRWWRNRRQMTLVERGGSWRIEGPDSERARVAFAALDNDRLVYEREAA